MCNPPRHLTKDPRHKYDEMESQVVGVEAQPCYAAPLFVHPGWKGADFTI